TVRAPFGVARQQIEEIVEKHRGWIEKKQAEAARRKEETRLPHIRKGDLFWFLGKQYPLSISEKSTHAVKLHTNRLILAKEYLDDAQAVLESWYRSMAGLVIPAKVQKHATKHNLTPARIRITSARTRWGSCSAKGDLNFSWRLIMAPVEVIDYVVVHELAHLKQRNHSKAFWAEVERMLPGCRQQRKWLKENGHRLGIDQREGVN
ncbi:MAG TPA: SprT family zinc-dependent metalloprotease, partial [Levilinea sp.]|nr:SprT family zinc-dependent metalloprotease [Levilinea sp.]